MNAKLLLKGDYISAVEFGDKAPTMSIREVRLVEFSEESGASKQKGVIFFSETPRGWIINRTNLTCLIAMFGDETDKWIGKRVTLHAQMVKFGGKTELGIRVKGSPDIDADMDIEVKLPRRRPVRVTIVKTQ